jgi:hypothetical protein
MHKKLDQQMKPLSLKIVSVRLHRIPILQDERRPRKYVTIETIAPPQHIPVPIRRTTSTLECSRTRGYLL